MIIHKGARAQGQNDAEALKDQDYPVDPECGIIFDYFFNFTLE
jgi:hypothetical protein